MELVLEWLAENALLIVLGVENLVLSLLGKKSDKATRLQRLGKQVEKLQAKIEEEEKKE